MEIIQHSFLDTKTCTICGESKPFSEFYERKSKPGSYYAPCRACNRLKRQNEYRRTDKETINAYSRKHYAEHREQCIAYTRTFRRRRPEINANASRRYRKRKQQNGGGYTRQEWLDLCAKYDFRCVACHQQRKLVADHIIPVCKGGPTTIENTQPLCIPCNSRKRDIVIDYR